MRTDQYTDVVRRRLHSTRARVMEDQPVGPGRALVGVRSENVVLTPMTIYIVVIQADVATGAMVRDFCRHADAYAKRMAGGGVGWVSAASTIAAVIANRSDPEAQAFAGQQTQVGWGTTLRPVLVDLGTGNVVCWLGQQFVGALAMDSVNTNVRSHFPLPAEARAEIGAAPGGPPPAPHGHPAPPPPPPPQQQGGYPSPGHGHPPAGPQHPYGPPQPQRAPYGGPPPQGPPPGPYRPY
ncbi:hypothetical protein ACFOVU_19190 [Nocardiopsis sediminis]|uniref:Uncharacterized protein n=1 Tax=Nocardiopsis sediminis TaxID=1778267 RepID=A0ABV8FS29_9ACTN